MPKRSRSPSPPSAANATLRSVSQDPEMAHTPKYHRASSSPEPESASESEAEEPSTPSSASTGGGPPGAATTAATARPAPMRCLLPPHAPLTLPSAAAFDAHYARAHAHRCAACAANLPSAHLLALHQAERHDPLAAARRARGDRTYACFVEGCDKLCAAPPRRRLHLIDKHGYPRDFDFRVVERGVDGRTSLLLRRGDGAGGSGGAGREEGGRRRRVSEVGSAGWQAQARERRGAAGQRSRRGTLEKGLAEDEAQKDEVGGAADAMSDQAGDQMDVESGPPAKEKGAKAPAKQVKDADVDQLVDSVAALRFVPLSVRLKSSRPST